MQLNNQNHIMQLTLNVINILILFLHVYLLPLLSTEFSIQIIRW